MSLFSWILLLFWVLIVLLQPCSSRILRSSTSINLCRSNSTGLTMSIASSTICCLTRSSIINSLARLGEVFTSNNQHYKLVSIMISYPKISKLLGLCGISCWQAISDLITISSTYFHIACHEIPLLDNASRSILSVILEPPMKFSLFSTWLCF